MKKILNTYFFGYPGYKYRRLIRTLILLICVGRAYFIVFLKLQGEDYDIIAFNILGFVMSVLLITALISFLMEPFIIEKKL